MKKLIIGLCVFCHLAQKVAAEEVSLEPKIVFSLGSGVPGADYRSDTGSQKIGKAGVALGIQYQQPLTPNVSWVADLSYTKSNESKSTEFLQVAEFASQTRHVVALLLARYDFNPSGRLLPYVFAGAGLHTTKVEAKATPVSGYVWVDTGNANERTIVNDSDANYALGLGTGLDFMVSEQWFLGAELRYQYLGPVEITATVPGSGSESDRTHIGLVNFFFRLGYRF